VPVASFFSVVPELSFVLSLPLLFPEQEYNKKEKKLNIIITRLLLTKFNLANILFCLKNKNSIERDYCRSFFDLNIVYRAAVTKHTSG
jgi:hypothetical protein